MSWALVVALLLVERVGVGLPLGEYGLLVIVWSQSKDLSSGFLFKVLGSGVLVDLVMLDRLGVTGTGMLVVAIVAEWLESRFGERVGIVAVGSGLYLALSGWLKGEVLGVWELLVGVVLVVLGWWVVKSTERKTRGVMVKREGGK